MTGRTNCPHCGTALRLQAGSLGKRVACGSCREVFTCTADRPSASASSRVIHCPHCRALLRLGPQSQGKKVRCSMCFLPFHTKPAAPTASDARAKPARQARPPQPRATAGNGNSPDGDFVRVGCPGCRRRVKVEKCYAGRRLRCPFCSQVFRGPRVENHTTLRSRLLEEVRQMRSRDQSEDGAPGVQAFQFPAEESETRQSVPVPEQAQDAAASDQAYQFPADDSQTRQSEPSPPPAPVKRRARPKEPPPVPEEEYQILPEELELARNGPMRRRNTKLGRGDYPRVQTGLTLNLTAAALLLGTLIIVLIAILFSAKAIYDATDIGYVAGQTPESSDGLPIATICLVILAAISEGIHIVGVGYCLGAPRKDAARTLAWIALLAAAAALSILCAAGALGLAGRFGIGGLALLIVGILLALSAKILYLLFLRGLGLAMEIVWLARQVFATIGLILAAAFFHLIVLAGAGFGLTGAIAGVATGAGSGTALHEVSLSALCFWFGSLLILLYALIKTVITINEVRNEVIYHLMRRK